MADPVLDAINQPAGKAWWQSKTVWGLVLTGISIVAPKYQPIAEALPPVIGDLGKFAGLLLGLYGRLRAEKPIVK